MESNIWLNLSPWRIKLLILSAENIEKKWQKGMFIVLGCSFWCNIRHFRYFMYNSNIRISHPKHSISIIDHLHNAILKIIKIKGFSPNALNIWKLWSKISIQDHDYLLEQRTMNNNTRTIPPFYPKKYKNYIFLWWWWRMKQLNIYIIWTISST